jgi:hypothetical protein
MITSFEYDLKNSLLKIRIRNARIVKKSKFIITQFLGKQINAKILSNLNSRPRKLARSLFKK